MTTTTEAVQGAAGHAAKGPIDPIHQFQIDRLIPIHLGPIDASLTNSGLWAIIAVCVVSLIFLLAPRNLVPSRFQSLAESIYEFVDNMVQEPKGIIERSSDMSLA